MIEDIGESLHVFFLRAIVPEGLRQKDKSLIDICHEYIDGDEHPHLFAICYRTISLYDPENIPLYFDKLVEYCTNKGTMTIRDKLYPQGHFQLGGELEPLSEKFPQQVSIAMDRWLKKARDSVIKEFVIEMYQKNLK